MRDVERRLRVIETAMAARGKPMITAGHAAAGAEWFNRRIERLIVQAEAAGDKDVSSQSEAERLAHTLVWGSDQTATETIARWKQRAFEGLKRLHSQ